MVRSLERERKPSWLKVRLPGAEGGEYHRIKALLGEFGLNTVCEEARCPNMAECWGGGTATFMLLGDICTRGCRFCSVGTGARGRAVDPEEPEHLAEVVARLGLDYVVLTSVDRDDLPDGGADHFARTVEGLHARVPDLLVEVLVSDFRGDPLALDRIVASGADVLAHNLETVRRLTPRVRDPRSTYDLSLEVLRGFKRRDPTAWTKSSIMLGLGEEEEEIVQAMTDLREAGVDFLTLGQYLRPTVHHLPVEAYVPPERFEALRDRGLDLGFRTVASGPLVRSSYRAGEYFVRGLVDRRRATRDASNHPKN